MPEVRPSEAMPLAAHSTGAGFADFFRLHKDRVAHIAARMLGRDADVDDVVQDVFSTVLRRQAELPHMPSPERWVVSLTVKRVLVLLRWRRVRARLGLYQQVEMDQLVGTHTSAEGQLTVLRMYRALDQLPASDRVAWLLRHVQGERLEDVATLSGCSVATAKRRITRAQARLDEVFDEEGLRHE